MVRARDRGRTRIRIRVRIRVGFRVSKTSGGFPALQSWAQFSWKNMRSFQVSEG
jgi:hypothetical protein